MPHSRQHVRVGHEGLGTVVTRALAITAIAGAIGLAQAWISKPIDLPPVGSAETEPDSASNAPSGEDASVEASSVAASETGVGIEPAASTTDISDSLDPRDPSPDAALRIDADEAMSLFEMGAGFIDARLSRDWSRGHVVGAVNLTPADITGGSDKLYSAFDALPDVTNTIVVYCDGGDECKASSDVRYYLMKDFGFTDIRIMQDGFDAWKKAGYPIGQGQP